MIGKRIDRYVSRAFLVRFIVTMVVICGLYLSFDALKRVDQLQKMTLRQAIPKIAAYYGYFFPARVLETIPPLLLIGAGLTLVQMSRDRELLTLKASGVSLQRVTAPLFLWTVAVAILVFWATERIVPACTRHYELLERDLDGKIANDLMLRDPKYSRSIFVGSYDYARGTMSRVQVIEFCDEAGDNRMKTKIQADSGTWRQDGRIGLENVTIQEFDENGVVQGDQPAPVLPTKLLETSLVPFDFVGAKQEAILPALALSELRRHVKANPNVPQFRVMLHSRLSTVLMPFLLLLVGIPLLVGYDRATESRVLAIVICTLVAAGLYVLSFVFVSLGNTGALNPTLAGWLHVLLVGPVGLWLFGSMRT